MADIRIVSVTDLDGIWADWLLKPDNMLDETEELVNIAKVALMTWGLADVDDIRPDPDSEDRYGWWGDLDAETVWDGWPIGAKLWLLSRSKITAAGSANGATLALAEEYCRVALQPMIDKQICSQIDVAATRVGIQQITVSVKIYRGPQLQIELRFQDLWDAIRN
jgi:phage gp46-like protein